MQQLLLQDSKAHILLLLDCCKASASIQYTSGTSVVEAVTAAGFENVTPLRGIHSFTSNLVSTLDDLQGRPITASHLCSKITARLKSYWPREIGNEKRVTPHHFSFNDDIETDVVVVAKMGQTLSLRIMESTITESIVEVAVQAESPKQDQVSLQHSSETSKLLSATSNSSLTRYNLSMEVERSASDSRSPSRGSSDVFQNTHRSRESRSPRSRSRLDIRRPGLRPSADIETHVAEQSPVSGTYKHIPVSDGEIRILHLLPGRNDEPIRCAFSTRILENDDVEHEDYHAVSYHFPKCSSTKAIEILKRSQYQAGFEVTYEQLLISEILHAALCRFRDAKITIPLFIDTLCVNYEDPKETVSQISLIPQVFYNACHVCVWLGEDTKGSVNLSSFISKVLDLSNVDNIVKSESEPEEWQAFAELMMRPWFGRRWVIQELISACDVTVYYGNDLAIDWQDFCDAVALFASKIEEIRELFKKSARYNPLMALQWFKLTILDLTTIPTILWIFEPCPLTP
jgi:hypothetical protein